MSGLLLSGLWPLHRFVHHLILSHRSADILGTPVTIRRGRIGSLRGRLSGPPAATRRSSGRIQNTIPKAIKPIADEFEALFRLIPDGFEDEYEAEHICWFQHVSGPERGNGLVTRTVTTIELSGMEPGIM